MSISQLLEKRNATDISFNVEIVGVKKQKNMEYNNLNWDCTWDCDCNCVGDCDCRGDW